MTHCHHSATLSQRSSLSQQAQGAATHGAPPSCDCTRLRLYRAVSSLSPRSGLRPFHWGMAVESVH